MPNGKDGLDQLLIEKYGIPESDLPAMRTAILSGKSPIANEILAESATGASDIAQKDMRRLTEMANLIRDRESRPRVYEKNVAAPGRQLIRDEAAGYAAQDQQQLEDTVLQEQNRLGNMTDWLDDLRVAPGGRAVTSNFREPGGFTGLIPLDPNMRRTVGEVPRQLMPVAAPHFAETTLGTGANIAANAILNPNQSGATTPPNLITKNGQLVPEEEYASQVAKMRMERAKAMRDAILGNK